LVFYISSIDSRIYDLQKDVCAINVKLDDSLNQSTRIYQQIEFLSNNLTSQSPSGFANTWTSLFSVNTQPIHNVDLLPIINLFHANSTGLLEYAQSSHEPFGIFFATCLSALSVLHQTLDVSVPIIPNQIQTIVDTVSTLDNIVDTVATTSVSIIENTLIDPTTASNIVNNPSNTVSLTVPTQMRHSNLFKKI
jgi:hypothetical protein